MKQPPDFLAEPRLAKLLAALPDARVVGGAVRDALADLEVTEVDLATPLLPEQVTRVLQDAGIRVVPTGLEHGTVTAVVEGRPFEITTLRRDVETDGRHAVVAFTDDWQADAARRDFTINAMSMTRSGEVFDYFGGMEDLRAGIVRFVGDPATRIAEDYLRILRYFRFFARFGKRVDPTELAAIQANVSHLSELSAERVRSELMRLLQASDPGLAVHLMASTGVLEAVLPEGADPAALAGLIGAGAPVDPLLRFAALLTGDPTAVALRLRFSAAERERLEALRRGPVPQPGADDDELRRLLADEGAEVLIDRCWLAGGAAPEWANLRRRLASLPRPVFPLEGRDVLALGVPAGPRVGQLLRAVRQWWMDSGCVADKAACQEELVRQAAAPSPRPPDQVRGGLPPARRGCES